MKTADESITFSLPKELRRDLRAEAAGSPRVLAGTARRSPGVARGAAPHAVGSMEIFGVDIGGSGIKGAPVDLDRGDLAQERHKVLTPHPATPDAWPTVWREVVGALRLEGPGRHHLPRSVTGGTTRTAANVDKGWIGTDARQLLSDRLGGSPVTVLNDADAAGVAEMHFGAGRDRKGTVILLTLGTGIGSALFTDGRLVPNTELGHLELHGHDAEKRASTKAKEDEDLSWQHWAHRVQKYLVHVEMLFSPELFIIGGGVSRKAEKFLPLIEHVRAEIVPAQLQNNAGIVGAAMAAAGRGVAGRCAVASGAAGGGRARRAVLQVAGRRRAAGGAVGPEQVALPLPHLPDLAYGGDETRDERAAVQPAGMDGERGHQAMPARRSRPCPRRRGSPRPRRRWAR